MGEKQKKEKSAKESLNPRQQKFCELYANDREFFGNGIQSYADAYNCDLRKQGGYRTAAAASRLLKNVKVLAYINEMLDLILNDVHVDKQLSFLITQNAELGTKLGAIKEYNALNERIKGKMHLNVGGMVKLILEDE